MILFILILALCGLCAYWYFQFKMRGVIALMQVKTAIPFTKEGSPDKALLVIGDSTGVGVGASRPEDSVAARVADYIHATSVENYAVSGSKVTNLPDQIAQAKLAHYALILIQIGANDIIYLHSPFLVSMHLMSIMKTLPTADKVIMICAGNIGAVRIVPPPLRPYYTWLTQRYHRAFKRVADQLGTIYVNLYVPRAEDPFRRDPSGYFSADMLHPSSAGYAVWFDCIKRYL